MLLFCTESSLSLGAHNHKGEMLHQYKAIGGLISLVHRQPPALSELPETLTTETDMQGDHREREIRVGGEGEREGETTGKEADGDQTSSR